LNASEIWRLNREQLASPSALDNLTNLMTAKSFADRQRQQHLEDIASERGYEQTAAQAASKRRMAEENERERVLALRQMADQGIPVRSDMSLDEAASAKKEFMTQRAGTQLDLIKSQMEAAQDKQKQAFDTIHRIASTPNLGNKEQRIQALRNALNDPSAAKLPDSVRAQLWNVISTNQDPAKAVDQAVQGLHSYWGTQGLFSGFFTKDQLANAQEFLQAYLKPLQDSASETQKADLMGAMKALEDANRERQILVQQAYSHIGANAGFLPPSVIKDTMKMLGPESNPNDVMKAVSSNPAVTNPTAAPVTTAPQNPRPARPFNQTTPIQQSMNAFSDTGGFAGKANFAPDSGNPDTQGSIFSNVGTVLGDAISGDRADLPPGPNEIQSFRAATRFMNPQPAVGPQQLVQATPQEKQQIELLVRSGLRQKGLPESQINQFIAQSNQKIQAGDPTAIQGANSLLKILRNASQSPLGLPGVNQSEPASLTPDASAQ